MLSVSWPAPAKLNLFLHITGRRADGYHLLQTAFQFIDWQDSLDFKVHRRGEVRRASVLRDVPPEQDLAVRAARGLKQHTGSGQGADIFVHKRIPPGGGLGGGSSDAATTLVALNHLWGGGQVAAWMSSCAWGWNWGPMCRCSCGAARPGPRGSVKK